MKVYIEAQGMAVEGTEPEFIRADITGKTQAEADAILEDIRAIMEGINCTLSRHFCLHDEGGACWTEGIA